MKEICKTIGLFLIFSVCCIISGMFVGAMVVPGEFDRKLLGVIGSRLFYGMGAIGWGIASCKIHDILLKRNR